MRGCISPAPKSRLVRNVERCCGPHICWFGEVPFGMDRIFGELRTCTVLLTIGSSGVVEPAASFVRMARMNSAKAIYIGPEAPANSAFFDEVVLGKAGEVLPKMVKEMCEARV